MNAMQIYIPTSMLRDLYGDIEELFQTEKQDSTVETQPVLKEKTPISDALSLLGNSIKESEQPAIVLPAKDEFYDYSEIGSGSVDDIMMYDLLSFDGSKTDSAPFEVSNPSDALNTSIEQIQPQKKKRPKKPARATNQGSNTQHATDSSSNLLKDVESSTNKAVLSMEVPVITAESSANPPVQNTPMPTSNIPASSSSIPPKIPDEQKLRRRANSVKPLTVNPTPTPLATPSPIIAAKPNMNPANQGALTPTASSPARRKKNIRGPTPTGTRVNVLEVPWSWEEEALLMKIVEMYQAQYFPATISDINWAFVTKELASALEPNSSVRTEESCYSKFIALKQKRSQMEQYQAMPMDKNRDRSEYETLEEVRMNRLKKIHTTLSSGMIPIVVPNSGLPSSSSSSSSSLGGTIMKKTKNSINSLVASVCLLPKKKKKPAVSKGESFIVMSAAQSKKLQTPKQLADHVPLRDTQDAVPFSFDFANKEHCCDEYFAENFDFMANLPQKEQPTAENEASEKVEHSPMSEISFDFDNSSQMLKTILSTEELMEPSLIGISNTVPLASSSSTGSIPSLQTASSTTPAAARTNFTQPKEVPKPTPPTSVGSSSNTSSTIAPASSTTNAPKKRGRPKKEKPQSSTAPTPQASSSTQAASSSTSASLQPTTHHTMPSLGPVGAGMPMQQPQQLMYGFTYPMMNHPLYATPVVTTGGTSGILVPVTQTPATVVRVPMGMPQGVTQPTQQSMMLLPNLTQPQNFAKVFQPGMPYTFPQNFPPFKYPNPNPPKNN